MFPGNIPLNLPKTVGSPGQGIQCGRCAKFPKDGIKVHLNSFWWEIGDGGRILVPDYVEWRVEGETGWSAMFKCFLRKQEAIRSGKYVLRDI